MSSSLGQVSGQGKDPTPSLTQSQQCLSTVEGTERESIEEDKSEEVKRRLRKRGIPEDNWQYYIKSPHSWDFSDVTSSALSKGVEVILLSLTTITPSWVERGSEVASLSLEGN